MTARRTALTDDRISRALAERAPGDPGDLLAQIVHAAEATPQRRTWTWPLGNASRPMVLLAAVALLILALAAAIAVGSGILRPSPILPTAYHHNGEITLATGGGVLVIDPATGAQRASDATASLPFVEWVDWSPDGASLALVANNRLYIRDDARGLTTQVGNALPVHSPIAWSPDGTRIAYEATDGVHVVDLASGMDARVPGTRETMGTQYARPSWSPDGREILYSAHNQLLYVAHVDGSGAQRLASAITTSDAAWSPDGTRIAYLVDPPDPHPTQPDPFVVQLWVADADGTHARKVFERPGCCLGFSWAGPNWSPDGRQVALLAAELWVVNVDGGGSRSLTDVPIASGELSWRPVP